MSDWTVEYKTKLREFVELKGAPVQFERQSWQYPQEQEPSVYGWKDYERMEHIKPFDKSPGCSWVVPEGAVLTERAYSQFVDTEAENEHPMGINVTPCHCACGQLEDVTLRYEGSLQEVAAHVLGVAKSQSLTL